MKWLGIAGLLIAGMVVFYVMAYPGLTLRYRLTLEAQVDGGPKVGSGVIEVTYSEQINIRSELNIGYRGEAVVLDLGDRGTTGILERLPWLKHLNGGYLDGAFAGDGPALSNVLFGGNFKTGS
jgi:hypothetical protein